MFNYVRDYWRGESRYLPLETGEGESVERQLPAVEENWDENLVAEEVKDALPAAIARLPHRQRLVVVWRYYDARSFEEIAEQLQVKPATVRSLLRHGIAALRQQLVQDEVAAG
jgi:RNA polymerase sigma factor (sigma-70 family)